MGTSVWLIVALKRNHGPARRVAAEMVLADCTFRVNAFVRT
jgi:hypothetical protein